MSTYTRILQWATDYGYTAVQYLPDTKEVACWRGSEVTVWWEETLLAPEKRLNLIAELGP